MTESAGLAALLMLADSRLPAGGHAHSGGIEPAVAAGLVRDVDDLAVFLRGRLHTAGRTAAALAAAACHLAADPTAHPSDVDGGEAGIRAAGGPGRWALLDAETDARIPSPAQRQASRQQGRALLRAGRAAWPAPRLDALAATPGGPHHPVALGAVAAAAGGAPSGAALVAGYLAVSGPAGAAVRLRGFDPLVVQAVLAGLTGALAEVAAQAAAAATGPPAELPCPAAPRLDLLAELHARSEVRLFAS